MNPRQGEIWLADLGLAAKIRPIIVISRNDENPPRHLYVYLPLTTQDRGSSYEVSLGHYPVLRDESVVNVQGIGSLPRPRLIRKLGELTSGDFKKTVEALHFLFGL